MIIKKLNIKNYRNFSNFEIELKKFNLIIGENNIGKTNLLNALGLIFSPDITFIQKRNLEKDDINYDAVQAFKNEVMGAQKFADIQEKFPEVKIEVILSDFNQDQEAIVGDWFTGEWNTDRSKNKAKITYLFSINHTKKLEEWFDSTRKSRSETKSIDIIDLPIGHYSYSIFGGDDHTKRIDYYWLNFLKMEFLDALRDAKTQLMASGKNTLLNKVLSARTDNKISDIKEKLLDLKKLINENSAFSTIKKDIEHVLKNISIENAESKIEFVFSGIESSDILKKISMIYGTNPIDIERNGLGRNNLLYISLLLSHLTQEVEKEDKKVFYRLIGIEEPEAHLHPHLQVHLSRNIDTERSDEQQLIITSHSTHITSQLSLEETIVLYRDEKENKIRPYYLNFESIPEDSRNYLARFLDATKCMMFFARKIILVEGISEQLLIPEFFKIMNNEESLEQKGITLINVNGIAFSHFLEIIKAGYFLKSVVYSDSDSTKKTAKRAVELRTEYNSEIIKVEVTKFNTFEADIINSNSSGKSKELLFEALIKTKTKNGPNLKSKTGNQNIDVPVFFKEIENYKAEFAMNLVEVLKGTSIEGARKNFNVPDYIKRGFEFIMDSNG